MIGISWTVFPKAVKVQLMIQDQELSFWKWSSTRYAYPGVESELISLQDVLGLNVNIVLWVHWCAEYFEPLTNIEVFNAVKLIREWDHAVTQPLRNIRRYINPDQYGDSEIKFRKKIKDAELESEYITHQNLQSYSMQRLARSIDSDIVAIKRYALQNMEQYVYVTDVAGHQAYSPSLLTNIGSLLYKESNIA